MSHQVMPGSPFGIPWFWGGIAFEKQCNSFAQLIENILLSEGTYSCLEGLLLKCQLNKYLQVKALSNEIYVVELIKGEITSENQK